MSLTLLVVANPTARYLRHLERLPDDVRIVVGNRLEMFEQSAGEADAILNTVQADLALEPVFRLARRVRWVHSMAAGVENILFPELVASPVALTNARGVYKRSLAEFALGSMLFFAKDLRRMLKNQAAQVWEPFDIHELYGHTLGIVGYGEIGRATAERARPFGMKIAALRRRPERSATDPLVDTVFAREQLNELLAASDYVLVATPLTPETRGMIGEAQLRAMKPSAVLINLGRGPSIVEEALVRALQEGRIRGAALDVFEREPLPAGHPFYHLENVLLSPHCADHTATWLEDSMAFFVENFRRFYHGEPLLNVVDKQAGY